jgi:hypothetical protein
MQERVKRRLVSIYASLGDYDALSSVAKPGERQPWMQSSAFRATHFSCLHGSSDMLLVFEEEASLLVPMPQLQNTHYM